MAAHIRLYGRPKALRPFTAPVLDGRYALFVQCTKRPPNDYVPVCEFGPVKQNNAGLALRLILHFFHRRGEELIHLRMSDAVRGVTGCSQSQGPIIAHSFTERCLSYPPEADRGIDPEDAWNLRSSSWGSIKEDKTVTTPCLGSTVQQDSLPLQLVSKMPTCHLHKLAKVSRHRGAASSRVMGI